MKPLSETLQETFSLNAPNMLLLQRTLIEAGLQLQEVDQIAVDVEQRCQQEKFSRDMIGGILASHNQSEELADTIMREEETHGMTYGVIACP